MGVAKNWSRRARRTLLTAVGLAFALSSCGTVVVWGSAVAPPTQLTGVTAITSGLSHWLALKTAGTVVGWGTNTHGEATPPVGLKDVVAVSAGSVHSLALKSDGTVVGWGWNDEGQVPPPLGLSDVVAIAAGSSHSLALKSDGTIVGWGYDTSAIPPAGLSGFVAIAASGGHSLALTSAGTVLDSGDVTNSPPLIGLTAIAAGSSHSLALTSDGTVVAWGSNFSGQIDVPTGLTNVVAIAARDDSSMALKRDGTVVTWGNMTSPPATVSGINALAVGGTSVALKGPALPTMSIGDLSTAEGTSGYHMAQFTVSLSSPAQERVSMVYGTLSGTATSGSDFAASFGSATIPAGSTSTTVSVPIWGDNLRESDESFSVRIATLQGATLGRAVGTGRILNDD